MEIIKTTEVPWVPVANNARTGAVERKFVREAEMLPGVGFTSDMIRYVGGEEPFKAPRHRHDFEQIRVSLEGAMDFGHGQVTKPGWVSYFPAGAFYGPEQIDGATIFIVQWSNAWVTREAHDQAVSELTERGEFRDGVYSYMDSDGKAKKLDALNAIWEHVFGRKSSFPIPPYANPVLMNPEGSPWVSRPDGTAVKVLGRFTQQDLIVFQIQWEQETVCLLPDDRTRCILTLTDGVRCGDEEVPRHTVIWGELDEKVALSARPQSEVLCIGFPPLDPVLPF